jgi:DoxX-like family
VSLATAVVSLLLAALLAFSAARKLGHRPEVVATYTRVGVPEDRLNHLAVILMAGAAGLVIGLGWAPLGLAAAAGVVVYFALAIAAHVRAGDLEHLAPPVLLAVLGAAALLLHVAKI